VKPVLHGVYKEYAGNTLTGEYIVLEIDDLNSWVTVHWTFSDGAETFPFIAMEHDEYAGQASELMLALL